MCWRLLFFSFYLPIARVTQLIMFTTAWIRRWLTRDCASKYRDGAVGLLFRALKIWLDASSFCSPACLTVMSPHAIDREINLSPLSVMKSFVVWFIQSICSTTSLGDQSTVFSGQKFAVKQYAVGFSHLEILRRYGKEGSCLSQQPGWKMMHGLVFFPYSGVSKSSYSGVNFTMPLCPDFRERTCVEIGQKSYKSVFFSEQSATIS